MYMTNEKWEQNNQDYLKESYWVLSGAKRRQIQQFCCFVLSLKDVETEIRKIIYNQIIYI